VAERRVQGGTVESPESDFKGAGAAALATRRRFGASAKGGRTQRILPQKCRQLAKAQSNDAGSIRDAYVGW
jgi:hypothetical protein